MIGCIIFVAYIPARFKIESCSIIPFRVDAKVLGSTVFNTFLCPFTDFLRHKFSETASRI